MTAYSRMGRKVGSAPLTLDHNEVRALDSAGFPSLQGHPLHKLARAAFLLYAAEQVPARDLVEFIDELFVCGDNAEREGVLRMLALLPDPVRFLATAVEACRTNVQTVFEAIACENPYPAGYFPELNFNQLVMKAVFTGVPLRRIAGLPARVTPALILMAGDHVKERTAAGRPVHEDIALITNCKG